MSHEGRDRPLQLHVPPTAPAEGWPLVLELHGRGIDAARFDQMTGFIPLADEAGFVLVAPTAVDEMWNDGRDPEAAEHGAPDDVRYLAAVLDGVAARLPIDRGRVYVVGMSNGASMAGRLVCELTERFAAVAQVAGTAEVDIAAGCRPDRPVPILQIHGTDDPYWPYDGGVGERLRSRVVLRQGRHAVVGVDAWARFWIVANGASGDPVAGTIAADTSARSWHGPTPASDVVFYRIESGGHTWPGGNLFLPRFLFGRTTQTFSATRAIWAFFSAHAR
jgi:polyhydroxybutyrate depolymerase